MIVWRGVVVSYSDAAAAEITDLCWNGHDVREILERGREAKRKRKAGIIEVCLEKRGRVRKIVLAESIQRWSGEVVWLVIHAGEYARG